MSDAAKSLEIQILAKYLGAEKAAQAAKDLENLHTTSKGASTAAADLSKEMGVVNVTHEDVAAATKKTSEATGEATEKFGESHREIRKVGNELGRMISVADIGGLALGGIAASAFALVKAVEFLKGTWEGLKETISGPIEIGIPENAAAHITAAANAWNLYATARGKVIETAGTPEATASAREKSLGNELRLIHEVLAAEKQKAIADLELKKDSLTPQAYAAARAGIDNIFAEAGTAADQKNRRALIANKDAEATNLETDAKAKMRQALAIKLAPKEEAENNQKTLDENAAAGEAARKEIKERIEFIKKVSDPDNQNDYTGPMGAIKKQLDRDKYLFRYGNNVPFADALSIEEPRLTQANNAIDVARTYRERQAANSEKQKGLVDEAGSESGKASVLRDQIKSDSADEVRQNSTDAQVAALHNDAAAKIAASSTDTINAVERVLGSILGQFRDVHVTFEKHNQRFDEQARNMERIKNYNHNP